MTECKVFRRCLTNTIGKRNMYNYIIYITKKTYFLMAKEFYYYKKYLENLKDL